MKLSSDIFSPAKPSLRGNVPSQECECRMTFLVARCALEPLGAPGSTYYYLHRGRPVEDSAVYKARWDVYTSPGHFRNQT